MILCIENPKDATRKLLELIREFSKISHDKISTQKSVAFLCTNNEKVKKRNSRNSSNYHHIKMNEIARNKPP